MSDAATLFADGAAYERRMGRWSRLVGEIFLDWLAAPAGLRWLDVGCGNGAFTEVLITRCAPAALSAVDPSEGQLSYARTRAGAELAEFRVGDAQALPYADRSFDAAAMALAISFVPDPLKAAREMMRVVKPGGLVATYMWDLPGGGVPVAPMYRTLQSLGIAVSMPGTEVSQRDGMQTLWTQAGLQSIETRVIRIPVAYTGFDEFWESYRVPEGPAGLAIRKMSPPEIERLKVRLREQLPIAADGSISYEAFANAVKGRAPN
ncbi:MAG: class I SAM-dependent methyltransferase [Bradyrhizobium sp.]|nr:class I SAM-dependent methyltransferase [Bradyrhizobium sp.]